MSFHQAPLRSMLALLFGALLLSGCGVFGDGEQAAAQTSEQAEAFENRTIRVTSGDRFFDIAPSSLVTAEGDLTSDAAETIAERVTNLSVGTADPTNAGIIFDGTEFVINPSIPGSTPDIDGLLAALTTLEEDAIDVPFLPILAEVSDEDAADYAAQLNERVAGGINVAVSGENGVLPASTIGEATTVDWSDGEWVVSVDYDGIATELNAMFADVGTDGGEASFIIERGDGDEPDQVVIVTAAPATVCCDVASTDQIIRAMTSNATTATLPLASVDGVRGTEWAESLGITELVASFTTQYTPGQDRNINIQQIAEITRGHIIEPGETWSLNERVGQRTTANGFVPAGTIVNGHLTDSVGGGISQYATTIFNAAFFAGLEFGNYQAHSIYFSRYPYGREATISWPAPQLEIINPTPHGILIWPTATDSSITVELYSTEWADAEQSGQFETAVQEACTRVTTERTRTFLDGTTDVDSVFAIYRQEGIGCNGEPTEDPDAPPEPEVPEGEDDESENDDSDGDGEEVPEGEDVPGAPAPTDPDSDPQQTEDPEAEDGNQAAEPEGNDRPNRPNRPNQDNPAPAEESPPAQTPVDEPQPDPEPAEPEPEPAEQTPVDEPQPDPEPAEPEPEPAEQTPEPQEQAPEPEPADGPTAEDA